MEAQTNEWSGEAGPGGRGVQGDPGGGDPTAEGSQGGVRDRDPGRGERGPSQGDRLLHGSRTEPRPQPDQGGAGVRTGAPPFGPGPAGPDEVHAGPRVRGG